MSIKQLCRNKYNSSNASIEIKNKKAKLTERFITVSVSKDKSKSKVNHNGNFNKIDKNNIIKWSITCDQNNLEKSQNLNEIINKYNCSNKSLLLANKNEENKNLVNITNITSFKKGKEERRIRKPIFRVIRRKRKRLLGTDNIKSKLQNYFLKFLFKFICLIIKSELFLDIDFKNFKIKSEKGSLKNKTIKELLSNDNIENERNIDDIIKKYPSLKKFFNTRCLKIFGNIYYANKYNIDLNEYGIDKKIVIVNELKLYDYFIEKNKNNIKYNPEYLKKIKLVIQNEFTDKIFNVDFCDKSKKYNK